jgi:hypothetical protein
MLEIQSGVPEIYRRVCRPALLLTRELIAYGFLKVRLPSHGGRIADVQEGASPADTVEKLGGSATRIPLVAFLIDRMGPLSCGAFAALA